jgi:peroxiredoxin
MKKNICTLFLLALTTHLFSQSTRTISGQVRSEEEGPLEGVAVAIKGTTTVSGSQPDGIYYIGVSDKDSVLVFSRAEFQTREVKISNANAYNIVLQKEQSAIANNISFSAIGDWRGEFAINASTKVPFNFEIKSAGKGEPKIYFLNADERFEGGIVTQTKDSVIIKLDQFENELAFRIIGNALEGVLRRQSGNGTVITVRANKSKGYRFDQTGVAPVGNISGTYDITFRTGNGTEEKSVGLFEQDGNKLKGTFLRITGDSRYLEGYVEGNNFYLSSFIGSSLAYYKGSFSSDGKLTGEIVGVRGSQGFTGIQNDNAALPDPYGLTLLKDGYKSFDFSFPDVNGNLVSLKDKKFKNKVVIITITGSWCPNCIDEAGFLAPWYKANQKRGVEAIAIHYERQTDTAFVRKVLTRFRKRFDITFTQVIAGKADKQYVASSLPALNTFLAFPTTIIVDKKGKVAKIHTGYSGPATGKYYDEFVKEFNSEIDSLLAER